MLIIVHTVHHTVQLAVDIYSCCSLSYVQAHDINNYL